MDDKPLTPFEEFVVRRIAEFPSLYHSKNDVISQCILGSQGDCRWENGVLVQPDQHYDPKTKEWTQYPLEISLKAAKDMHAYSWPKLSYDVGRNARAPIENLPNDAEKSYLMEISIFLSSWSELSDEDWEILAKAKCLVLWHRSYNEHAGEPRQTLENFLKFKEMIPKWEAAINEVYYFQRYGHIDPRTFMGADI